MKMSTSYDELESLDIENNLPEEEMPFEPRSSQKNNLEVPKNPYSCNKLQELCKCLKWSLFIVVFMGALCFVSAWFYVIFHSRVDMNTLGKDHL